MDLKIFLPRLDWSNGISLTYTDLNKPQICKISSQNFPTDTFTLFFWRTKELSKPKTVAKDEQLIHLPSLHGYDGCPFLKDARDT
jgi:hypothetical protein